jgi:hypothetical protein
MRILILFIHLFIYLFIYLLFRKPPAREIFLAERGVEAASSLHLWLATCPLVCVCVCARACVRVCACVV